MSRHLRLLNKDRRRADTAAPQVKWSCRRRPGPSFLPLCRTLTRQIHETEREAGALLFATLSVRSGARAAALDFFGPRPTAVGRKHTLVARSPRTSCRGLASLRRALNNNDAPRPAPTTRLPAPSNHCAHSPGTDGTVGNWYCPVDTRAEHMASLRRDWASFDAIRCHCDAILASELAGSLPLDWQTNTQLRSLRGLSARVLSFVSSTEGRAPISTVSDISTPPDLGASRGSRHMESMPHIRCGLDRSTL